MERCAVGYMSNTYTHIIQRLVFGVTASEMVRKILQDLDKRKYFGSVNRKDKYFGKNPFSSSVYLLASVYHWTSFFQILPELLVMFKSRMIIHSSLNF